MKTELFIAAGGKGTRLSEITKHTPKSMIKVGSQPIIDHLLSAATGAGIDTIVVGIDDEKELLRSHLASTPAVIQNGCYEPLTSAFFESIKNVTPDIAIGSNGDTIYHSEAIQYLLERLAADKDAGAAVLLSKVVRPIDASTWTYWRHRIVDDQLVAMDEVPGHTISTEYVLSAYRMEAIIELTDNFRQFYADIGDVPFEVYSYGWDYILRLLLWKGIKVAGYVSDDISLNINHPEDIEEAKVFFSQPSLFRQNRMTALGESLPRAEELALIITDSSHDAEFVIRTLATHGLALAVRREADSSQTTTLVVRGYGAFYAANTLQAELEQREGIYVETITARSSFERAMQDRLHSL